MRASAAHRHYVAVFPTMIGGDGETVVGGKPILGQTLLAVRADVDGDQGVAGLLEAES